METGVIIAVASFLGAILGAALSNLVTARLASQERKEARYKEELVSLRKTMDDLIETYSRFINIDSAAVRSTKWNEEYTRFAAICLSIGDAQMKTIGDKVLRPENDVERNQSFQNALIRLSEIINEFVAKHRLE